MEIKTTTTESVTFSESEIKQMVLEKLFKENSCYRDNYAESWDHNHNLTISRIVEEEPKRG